MAFSVPSVNQGPKQEHGAELLEVKRLFSLIRALLSFHSIKGFLCLPTIATPRQCRAFASPARMIVASGSIGFSALTWAASLAACSMASISALQLA